MAKVRTGAVGFGQTFLPEASPPPGPEQVVLVAEVGRFTWSCATSPEKEWTIRPSNGTGGSNRDGGVREISYDDLLGESTSDGNFYIEGTNVNDEVTHGPSNIEHILI